MHSLLLYQKEGRFSIVNSQHINCNMYSGGGFVLRPDMEQRQSVPICGSGGSWRGARPCVGRVRDISRTTDLRQLQYRAVPPNTAGLAAETNSYLRCKYSASNRAIQIKSEIKENTRSVLTLKHLENSLIQVQPTKLLNIFHNKSMYEYAQYIF